MKSFFGLLILSWIISSSLLFGQTPLPAPKQEKLLNGLKVLMWPDAKSDKVAVKIRVHSGSAFDPQGKEGLMQMLADNLFPNEASREFFTEDLGGNLEIIANYDYIQINASSSASPEKFLTLLETVGLAISNPSINKETTVNLRAAQLAKVATMEADPAYVADQAVAKRLFGTFPYGRPQYGTADSLKKIEVGDLIDAKNRFLTADNATLAVSGNFDKAFGYKAIRRYFGGWLKADKKVPATFRQPDEPQTDALILMSPIKDQSATRYAYRGVSRSERDFGPSMVLSVILQNRLRTRAAIPHETAVTVRNSAYALPGIVMASISSELNGNGSPSILLSQLEFIKKSINDPISEAEFQLARNSSHTKWANRDASLFWLDADTYNLAPAIDVKIFETVIVADVRAYSEKAKRLPLVSVLVSAPTTPAN